MMLRIALGAINRISLPEQVTHDQQHDIVE